MLYLVFIIKHVCFNGKFKIFDSDVNPKQKEVTLLKDGLTPDVLNSTNCVNCNRWENKYVKAKQTLAATLEKLQAANVRKEKVDRALSKELGKTHNILSQVKRI